MSKVQGIQADGNKWVAIYFQDEMGSFQGHIPVALCRFHDGHFESVIGTGIRETYVHGWDDFTTRFTNRIAQVTEDDVSWLIRSANAAVRGSRVGSFR